MATTAELITQLYVGYYNRAPDPEGLNYWIGRVNAGVSLADIANSFAASPEAIATYPYLAFPNVANAETFLEQIYQNLFNRSIDADGRAYYANKLATGQTTPGQIIAEIQANANTNPNNTDGQVLANKVTVGLDFALEAAATPGFEYEGAAVNQANTVLDNVTDSQASVDAALASNDSFFEGGVPTPAVTLTTGVDVLSGGTGNDTFIATSSATTPTLNLGDQVNGGAGNDTLQIITNLAGAVPAPTTKSVETYQITNSANGSLAVNAQSDAPSAVNFVGGGNNTFTLSGVSAATAVGLQNEAGQLTLTLDKVTGTADALALNLNGAKATASVAADGIETFNVATSGANSTLAALTGAQGATLNVSGDKNLTVTAALANTFTKVDASSATGNVNIGVTAGGNVTFTGGKGNDRIDLAAGFNNNDTVNGGEGIDTLAVGADITVTPTKLSNVERIEFTAATTQDLSLIGNSIKTFAYSVDDAAIAVTNSQNDFVHVLEGVADTGAAGTPSFSATAALNGPADVLNVQLQDSDLATLTATNYETLNLVSGKGTATGPVTNVVTALANSAGADVVITGDTDLTITGVAAQGNFDASALTGKLVITGSAAADVIKGGSAVDTITAGVGADVVSGGAGSDIFVVSTAAGATDSTDTAYDSITDWNVGGANDILRFAAAENVAGAAAAAPVATASVQISAGGKVTFAAADDTLAEKIAAVQADNVNVANNEVVFFEHGGDTYVYGAGADTTAAADDFLVKLVGVTGLNTLAESTTTAGDFTLA